MDDVPTGGHPFTAKTLPASVTRPNRDRTTGSADVQYSYEDVMPDLTWLYDECHKRCLIDGMSWATEIMCQVPKEWQEEHERCLQTDKAITQSHSWRSNYKVGFGWALIQQREFHRATFYLNKIEKPTAEVTFLYYWARFLASEHNRLEVEAELINRENRDRERYVDDDMKEMLQELLEVKRKEGDNMDIFLLYILGRVQASMQQLDVATSTFQKVVSRERRFWPAYRELIQTMQDVNEIQCVESKDHYWMMNIFRADALVRFQHHRFAVVIYQLLRNKGFGLSVHYINAPLAACKAKMQEHESALNEFQRIREDDPYRIHLMDLYSDSLYVRGNKVKLCQLSQELYKTHKFTYEVCCILANYYSLRREHDKAIAFLQRAIRLNPLASLPWVLVGHEFMEVKNSSAACLAYRKATEIDPSDARGWYGLGQLYDILKMNSYSLEYYKRAHRCKPDDSRMLVALGNVYENVNRLPEAKATYIKAYKVGDIEGTALIHLAQVCERRKEMEHAAAAYETYVVEYADIEHVDNMCACLKYLANYYIDKKNLLVARQYASKCMDYEPVVEDGRTLTKRIDNLMNKDREPPSEDRTERRKSRTRSQSQSALQFEGPSSGVLANRNVDDAEMQEDRDEPVADVEAMDESAAENIPGEGDEELVNDDQE